MFSAKNNSNKFLVLSLSSFINIIVKYKNGNKNCHFIVIIGRVQC